MDRLETPQPRHEGPWTPPPGSRRKGWHSTRRDGSHSRTTRGPLPPPTRTGTSRRRPSRRGVRVATHATRRGVGETPDVPHFDDRMEMVLRDVLTSLLVMGHDDRDDFWSTLGMWATRHPTRPRRPRVRVVRL